MLAFSLITCGILLRFVEHAPNFTPVAAIALFGGVYLNRRYALIVPLALMMVSDVFLGMHNVVFFTWGGFVLTALLGLWLKKRKSAFGVVGTSLASSFLFYIVSNFGVWLMGWYPRTLEGLINCYVMALPFLRNFTLATLIYAGVFFGLHELIARLVKDTKFSSVLLSAKVN
jgi:LPXTG-motif cell wall-anchored protein